MKLSIVFLGFLAVLSAISYIPSTNARSFTKSNGLAIADAETRPGKLGLLVKGVSAAANLYKSLGKKVIKKVIRKVIKGTKKVKASRKKITKEVGGFVKSKTKDYMENEAIEDFKNGFIYGYI